jgi:hypothetical protein
MHSKLPMLKVNEDFSGILTKSLQLEVSENAEGDPLTWPVVTLWLMRLMKMQMWRSQKLSPRRNCNLAYQIWRSLITGGRERRTLTQSEKHQGYEYSVTSGAGQELNVPAAELKTLQEGDPTQREVWKTLDGHSSPAGVGFYQKDGLHYRCWSAPGHGAVGLEVEQLLLSLKCRVG